MFRTPLFVLTTLLLVITCAAQDSESTTDSESTAAVETAAVAEDGLIRVVVGDNYQHDMGILTPRQEVKMEFLLVNESDEDFVIDGLRATCGCTVPERDFDVIPAHGSVTLPVTFRANATPTVKTSNIMITPAEGNLWRISLRADVRSLVPIVPSSVAFSNVSISDEGVPVTQKVVLTNTTDVPVTITEVTGVTDIVQVMDFEPKTMAPGASIEYTIALIPPDLVTTISQGVHFKTDHPQVEEVNANVTARITGSLSASPPRLWFGFIPAGTHKEVTVTLTSETGQSFDILDVEMPEELGVELSYEQVDDKTWTVTATLDATVRTGGVVHSNVMIKTNIETEPEFELGMLGGVREP